MEGAKAKYDAGATIIREKCTPQVKACRAKLQVGGWDKEKAKPDNFLFLQKDVNVDRPVHKTDTQFEEAKAMSAYEAVCQETHKACSEKAFEANGQSAYDAAHDAAMKREEAKCDQNQNQCLGDSQHAQTQEDNYISSQNQHRRDCNKCLVELALCTNETHHFMVTTMGSGDDVGLEGNPDDLYMLANSSFGRLKRMDRGQIAHFLDLVKQGAAQRASHAEGLKSNIDNILSLSNLVT